MRLRERQFQYALIASEDERLGERGAGINDESEPAATSFGEGGVEPNRAGGGARRRSRPRTSSLAAPSPVVVVRS
jgi:hypothetical protein